MKIFWITLASLLLTIAAFNGWVDLAHRWHRQPNFFARAWASDEAWVSPVDFDEGEGRERHAQLIERPDLLALGSSRVLLVDSQMFRRTIRFYNAGISASGIEELAAVWQIFKESGKIPAYVIFFLDPWNLSDRRITGKSRAALRAYERFLRSHWNTPEARRKWVSAATDTWLGDLAQVTDLLSWETTCRSIQYSREKPWTKWNSGPGGIVKLSTKDPQTPAWRFDGAAIYSDSKMVPPTPENIDRVARGYATGNDWTVSQWLASEPEIPPGLTWLVSDMVSRGTKVMLISPPFQPTALAWLRRREETRKALEKTSNLLENWSRERRISFCDRTDARGYCDGTEFMDAYHMLRSCVEKVIQSCLQQSSDWTHLARPVSANDSTSSPIRSAKSLRAAFTHESAQSDR